MHGRPDNTLPCTGIVLSKLGAIVTATDLQPNLRLLSDNLTANGAAQGKASWSWHERASVEPYMCKGTWPAGAKAQVREHTWGTDAHALQPPFDVVVACGAYQSIVDSSCCPGPVFTVPLF